MNTTLRATAAAVGYLPLLLIGFGLYTGGRLKVPLIVAGVLWGMVNVILSRKQINATVTETGATLSYPVAEKSTAEL